MNTPTLPPYPAPPPMPRTSGKAITALVLGLLGLWIIPAILALIFGYSGKREIDRSNGWITGRGMAVAGIVLGWIGVSIWGGIIVLAVIGAVAEGGTA